MVDNFEGPFYDGSGNPHGLGSEDYNGGVADKTLPYIEIDAENLDSGNKFLSYPV